MGTNNSCDYTPTQYNVITGGASGTINNVAPSATSGVPLISQGSSSQPAFGTAVVGGGGTGITSATAYAPICAGTTTTGNFQVASTGLSSSGFVLTSNGSSALPSFQAAAGGSGSWVKLQTQTASSSASISFSSTYITSTYRTYVVILENLVTSSSGTLEMTISTDNGSTYLNSGYVCGSIGIAYNTGTGAFGAATTNTTYFPILVSSTTAITGTLWIYNLDTTNSVTILGDFWGSNANWYKVMGYNSGTTAVNNIKFLFASGNITSGKLTLYGITP